LDPKQQNVTKPNEKCTSSIASTTTVKYEPNADSRVQRRQLQKARPHLSCKSPIASWMRPGHKATSKQKKLMFFSKIV
jgi:hypothetical protein